jgi:hypothetical protein
MSVFQDLYDSEINFSMAYEWDAGFEVKLGGGYLDNWTHTTFADSVEVAEQWLETKAMEEYPDSKFAEDWHLRHGIFHAPSRGTTR